MRRKAVQLADAYAVSAQWDSSMILSALCVTDTGQHQCISARNPHRSMSQSASKGSPQHNHCGAMILRALYLGFQRHQNDLPASVSSRAGSGPAVRRRQLDSIWGRCVRSAALGKQERAVTRGVLHRSRVRLQLQRGVLDPRLHAETRKRHDNRVFCA